VSLSLLFRSAAIYFSAALVFYALAPGTAAPDLLKLLLLAAGLSLATPLAYPAIRGVRRGDEVELEASGLARSPGTALLRALFRAARGTALEGGRKGKAIDVLLASGAVEKCVIASYEGFFSPARVRPAGREAIDASAVRII
jgi:hypothetical protein